MNLPRAVMFRQGDRAAAGMETRDLHRSTRREKEIGPADGEAPRGSLPGLVAQLEAAASERDPRA